MRWTACGNEAHGIEAELFSHFHGKPQMTAMDRIEGPAEDTNDAHSGPQAVPSPWLGSVWLVRPLGTMGFILEYGRLRSR